MRIIAKVLGLNLDYWVVSLIASLVCPSSPRNLSHTPAGFAATYDDEQTIYAGPLRLTWHSDLTSPQKLRTMPLHRDHQEVRDAPVESGGHEDGHPGDHSDHANGRFVMINNADDGQQQGDDDGQTRSLLSLHPYTRPLTITDLDSCVALENAAFDENERCSPEKVSCFLYVTCRSYSSPLLPLRRL